MIPERLRGVRWQVRVASYPHSETAPRVLVGREYAGVSAVHCKRAMRHQAMT